MKTLATILSAVGVLVASTSYAETLNACDQKLDYKVQAPAAGSVGAGFSGVWTGKWDTGLCGALVVESIGADGTAKVLYVWGSLGGQYSMKAGNRRFEAKIKDNKLSVNNERMNAEYFLGGPTQASGTYTNNYGSFKGAFTKQ